MTNEEPILTLKNPNPYLVLFTTTQMYMFYFMSIIMLFSDFQSGQKIGLIVMLFILAFPLSVLTSIFKLSSSIDYKKVDIYNSKSIVVNDEVYYENVHIKTTGYMWYSEAVHISFIDFYSNKEKIARIYLTDGFNDYNDVSSTEIENLFNGNIIK